MGANVPVIMGSADLGLLPLGVLPVAYLMATSTASSWTAAATEPQPQPQPTLAPRQEFRTITQTVRLADTTFVTEVTLGGPPRLADNDPTAAPTPSVRETQSPSSLTGAVLGAILGSVLGFVLLAALAWCCLLARRRKQQREEEEEYDDAMHELSPEEAPPPLPSGHRPHGQYPQNFFYMPAPPKPIYEVNRQPPWIPIYSWPARHLRW